MIEACYKLSFSGGIHVDGRGTAYYERGEPFVRSDTLSAAVASCWLQLFPDDEKALFDEPGYLISSAFPFFGQHLFLPRPVGSKADSLPVEQAKEMKKAQWLALPLWLRAANGEGRWQKSSEIRAGGVMVSANSDMPEYLRLWDVEAKPRIAVDRGYNGAAEGLIFHFARVHYQPDGGLYFLARFDDKTSQLHFEAALRLLGDCGLGSDRNSGHGHFTFIREKVPELDCESAVCLSLVNPSLSDMQSGWLDQAAYELTRRGGWIGGSSWRKGSIRMFVEGSQFSKRLRGQMVQVGSHPIGLYPVYRDGRAFMVGGAS